MSAKALMFQGTGSDVGKSTVVAGLCRLASRRGIKVAPFKPQNMSNNAAVCPGGGEIGRAQALQAMAAGLEFQTDFNPVLLKPQSDCSAQIVVNGKVLETSSAAKYMNDTRSHLRSAVMNSFKRLCGQYDLVLVEGAGSPAEVNLRDRDIANMGFALPANVPVCLIGDIDRGGVIASIVGTSNIIDTQDREMICSFIINRFRGDPTLFLDGLATIENLTGWPSRGILPWIPSAMKLPQEDAVVLERWTEKKSNQSENIRIAVPMLSRIANFDDIDPLKMEPRVELTFIPPGNPIPLDADAIILPGTKSTLGDLAFMRSQGWDHDVIAFARAGGYVLGLCGGYQLLGLSIDDPEGADGNPGREAGLGLLQIETRMTSEKATKPVSGHSIEGNAPIEAYEIHCGTSWGPDTTRPLIRFSDRQEGASNLNKNVQGTYLHGLFTNDLFRSQWLSKFGTANSPIDQSPLNYRASIETELDSLADSLEQHLDADKLFDDATPSTLR